MTDSNQQPILDFDAIEYHQNQSNLNEMKKEIEERSPRLATRISHFSSQFGLPEDDYWADLEANLTGPLASVLAKEARRQNIHENAAGDYIRSLKYVCEFRKLPSSGPNASYLNRDGQIITKEQLGNAVRPSKSIDFQWITGSIACYAAQKYTKVAGGNQDNQFHEIERLLQNFLLRTNNSTAFFVLVDGPYYTEEKLTQLRQLTRLQSPRSYVTSINSLYHILRKLQAGHID